MDTKNLLHIMSVILVTSECPKIRSDGEESRHWACLKDVSSVES